MTVCERWSTGRPLRTAVREPAIDTLRSLSSPLKSFANLNTRDDKKWLMNEKNVVIFQNSLIFPALRKDDLFAGKFYLACIE